MPRRKTTPKYCLHKATGQAVVRIDGRDRYLGKHGTPESYAEYTRLIYERQVEQPLANSPTQPALSRSNDVAERLTVSEVLLAYWKFAQTYYVKNGKPSSELESMRSAVETLDKLYT